MCGCFLFLPVAHADLPLTVEDLLTAAQRWRVDVGMAYANSDTTATQTGQFVEIQIGPTQFVSLPTAVGESRRNSDTLVLTPGLRYGLRGDTELYGRFSYAHTSTRTFALQGAYQEDSERLTDAWLGINHRFIKEGTRPALLGFIELAAAENVARTGTKLVHGKTGLVGLTTYRAIDPIVLAFTAAYRWHAQRPLDNGTQNPGDLLLLNPSVSFAVNHEVTLSSGLHWRWQRADQLNDIDQGLRTTRTSLNLGLGYAWSQRLTLNFNSRANISGRDGADLDLTLSYKLGDLPKRERKKASGGEQ